MEKIKLAEFELVFARNVVNIVFGKLKKEYPTLKGVNSEIFHNVCYFAVERIQKNPDYSPELKAKTNLTRGDYLNGPYVLAIDDVLVEMGLLKPEHHQFYGEDPGMEKLLDY
jgi:hypothetical protein